MFFVGAAHAGFCDDKREIGGIEVAAEVADEVSEVAGVFVVEGLVDAVIPALVPGDTAEYWFAAGEFGEFGVEVLQELVGAVDDFLVVGAGSRSASGRRAKVNSEALSAPGEFEQDDGVFACIADDGAETEFGANAVWSGPKAGLERSFAVEVMNEHVISLQPIAVWFAKFGEWRIGAGFGEVLEAAFAAVALGVGRDEAMAFHVGLAGEQEDADGVRWGGRRLDWRVEEEGEKEGEHFRGFRGGVCVGGGKWR